MATAKKSAASGSDVAVKKTGTNIVNIRAQLEADLLKLKSQTQAGGGDKIQIKAQSKQFALPDGQLTNELELVIVDFVTVYQFYQGKYDPKNIVPAACFAIGEIPTQLVPSNNSPDKQSDSCSGCPNNQFGSDGDGKACKNMRRLAVLPPDADDSTPLWLLDVSPTAIKGFDGYVNSVARQFNLPPVGVITRVSFDPNQDYARLMFSDPRPNENLEGCYARKGEAKDRLLQEPDVSAFVAAKPAKKVVNARR